MSKKEVEANISRFCYFQQCEIWSYYKSEGVFYLGNVVQTNYDFLRQIRNTASHYNIIIGDQIKYRYEIVERRGRGSYGLVVAAIDHKTNARVAIKVFRQDSFCHGKWVQECMLLEYIKLCSTENETSLCHIIDSFVFRKRGCIVLSLCELDLFKAMHKVHNGLDLPIVRNVIRSTLKGLRCMHKWNLFHGDLKPNNIAFLNQECFDVAIIDLGNSKFGQQEAKKCQQCQFYRPPEYILGYEKLNSSLDMWSLGCMAYELATGTILFNGDSSYDQLIRIMEIMGLPPPEIVQASTKANEYFNEDGTPKYCLSCLDVSGNVRFYNAQSRTGKFRYLPGKRNAFSSLERKSPELVNFIKKCLCWYPNKRPSAEEAMYHTWIREETFPHIDTDRLKTISNTTKLRESKSVTLQTKVVYDLKSTTSAIECSPNSDNLKYKWLTVNAKYFKFTKGAELPSKRTPN